MAMKQMKCWSTFASPAIGSELVHSIFGKCKVIRVDPPRRPCPLNRVWLEVITPPNPNAKKIPYSEFLEKMRNKD